jgi:hypothetical protein
VHPQRKNKTGAREIHRLSHLVLRSVEESECAVGQRARVGKGAAVEAGVKRGRGYGAELLYFYTVALPFLTGSHPKRGK